MADLNSFMAKPETTNVSFSFPTEKESLFKSSISTLVYGCDMTRHEIQCKTPQSLMLEDTNGLHLNIKIKFLKNNNITR